MTRPFPDDCMNCVSCGKNHEEIFRAGIIHGLLLAYDSAITAIDFHERAKFPFEWDARGYFERQISKIKQQNIDRTD